MINIFRFEIVIKLRVVRIKMIIKRISIYDILNRVYVHGKKKRPKNRALWNAKVYGELIGVEIVNFDLQALYLGFNRLR